MKEQVYSLWLWVHMVQNEHHKYAAYVPSWLSPIPWQASLINNDIDDEPERASECHFIGSHAMMYQQQLTRFHVLYLLERRPYWVWVSEVMGLRPNSFFTRLGNFSEPKFLQQENSTKSYSKGCCWRIKKVKCVKGHNSSNLTGMQ